MQKTIKLISFLLLFCFPLWACAESTVEDLTNDSDKHLHVALTSAISASAYGVYRVKGYSKWSSLMGGIGWGVFASVAKEVADPKIDPEDLQVDGLGIFLGVTLGLSFDWD